MLKWFSKKRKDLDLLPLDFSVLKTDIHSHFIPGIDDGAPNMKEAVTLIVEMQKLGYKKLITTPHVMSDFYKNSSETILKGLDDLRNELAKKNVSIEIDAAAEYYVDYDFEQNIKKEKLLTFGDGYLLVEFPFLQEPKNFLDIIFRLQISGYKVVLAHPERYHYFEMKDYENLANRGVLFQINFLSLIGYYCLQTKHRAEDLVASNMVSFIGSDCHNMQQMSCYIKCQTKKSWHDLYKSGTLLNNTL